MTFFYQELDLPPIPEELYNPFPTTGSGLTAEDIGYGYPHFKNGERIHACTYKWGRVDDSPLLVWLKENIPHIAKHLANPLVGIPGVFMQTTTPRHESGGAHIVHSDIRRIAGLNYHWATGGDAVVNRWYKEKGKPIIRRKTAPGIQSDSGRVKYDDLETMAEIITKPGCWYLINVASLHDVQNIQSVRQGVTVPFETNAELRNAGFDIEI